MLELQQDSLQGLWPLGMALCGLGRNDEGVTALERAVVLSRAPMYLGQLGLAYGRAGRTDDARRLLSELEDRASRGEYLIPTAPLNIHAGIGDFAGVRRGLAACMDDGTPVVAFKMFCGLFLDAFRTDSEIARLLDAMYGTTAAPS